MKKDKKNIMIEEQALHFIPFGGSEEFGCNLNFYSCDGHDLLIDCGLGFADHRYPGIDLLLPDPTFAASRKDKLKGLIITHAHEDHIGAVAYLWDRLECPIYTTAFTASVLRKKFEQQGIKNAIIHVIPFDKETHIGCFTVTFHPVSHSVPESAAIAIETPYGNILHSGDWNLDPAPALGKKTEEQCFRDIGNKGVLAYVGDSTNAQVNGYSGSEADVAIGMQKEFMKCHGKIVVTMFSSNIGRLVSIVRAAQKAGRSVALAGRSLHRMVACAYECGYLSDVPDFIDSDDIENIADENLVLVVTGSQGEHRAALARISRGENRHISLKQGDTVIFSSRAIPGNEGNINTVKNALIASSIRVVTPSDTENTIHVSGHPCREEIASMLQWVKPQCVIPVHGERTQLDAQAKLSHDCQVGQTIIPNNGSVICLAPGNPRIVDHVETGMIAVDQKRLIPATHQSITARRKLQYSGTLHASILLDRDFNVLGDIKMDSSGLTDFDGKVSFHAKLIDKIEDMLDDVLEETPSAHEDDVAEHIRINLRRYVQDILGILPKTTVHVRIINN